MNERTRSITFVFLRGSGDNYMIWR